MHFHVTQTLLGSEPHELGGRSSIRYPSDRPTYRDVEEAVDTVVTAAVVGWGLAAGARVEVALVAECRRQRHWSPEGAVAGWAGPDGGGAWWSVRACECADGTLARLFTDGHL